MLNGSGSGAAYRKAGPYMGLGIEFAVTVIVCFVGGQWLDGKMGSEPILALVGLLVGIGGATFHLLRAVNRLSDRERDKANTEPDESTDE